MKRLLAYFLSFLSFQFFRLIGMQGGLSPDGPPCFNSVTSYALYNDEHTELITMIVQCPNCKTFTKPIIRGSIHTNNEQRPIKLDYPVRCMLCDWIAIYENTIWTDLI